LLHKKGLLQKCFTQNIDTLERFAGMPEEKIVEAHGSFAQAHCIDCRKEFSQDWIKNEILAGKVARCECGGLVKPDIIFFGENLPAKFFDSLKEVCTARHMERKFVTDLHDENSIVELLTDIYW
jgi:NAD-dependent deacetylase sirtuin 2